jgi:hypothetical protein
LNPSPEMNKLPSSRSASPQRTTSPGKAVVRQEIEHAGIKSTLDSQVEIQDTKPITPNLKVVRNDKLASINRSKLGSTKDTVSPQSIKRTVLKPIPPQVPLEKLQKLQELLNNKDLLGHVPKRVRNLNAIPVIAPAAVPTSAHKIDPERAAKGRQYIKDRKIQELKKKRQLAEQEARERVRVSNL